jgi:hypothetical protein
MVMLVVMGLQLGWGAVWSIDALDFLVFERA